MTVIKDNFHFPIYCDDAEPIRGEKNFRANGGDIVDTVKDADLYVKKTGDDMTGPLYFTKEDTSQVFSIRPNRDAYTTNIYAYNSGTMRLRTASGEQGSPYYTHFMINRGSHMVGDTEFQVKTELNYVRTPIQNHHAANRWYVDDKNDATKEELQEQIEILNNQVIELEEEINSIAAAVVRGKWTVNSGTSVVTPQADGEFVMLQADGTNTDDYRLATKILFADIDTAGGGHSFADVTVDEYLQILNEDDDAYGLYTITVKTANGGASTPYHEFEVNYDQSFGSHLATGLARVKLFTPPVMDDSEFIVRGGDTMEGTLNFGTVDDHKGRLRVFSQSSTADNKKLFEVNADDGADNDGGWVIYNGRIEEDNDIITKKYYEENFQFGPEGPQGEAATIEVDSTITIDYPGNAEVENVGTEHEAKFKFTLPRGPQGPEGEKGSEVEIVTSMNPPDYRDPGSLVLTGAKKLYIYY